MKNTKLKLPEDKIAEFCQRWKIAKLELFGSALREDFGPDSDVDFLVTYEPDAKRGLFEHVRMENELKEIMGRDVDLITRSAVEKSRNWLRRKSILQNVEEVYVAG